MVVAADASNVPQSDLGNVLGFHGSPARMVCSYSFPGFCFLHELIGCQTRKVLNEEAEFRSDYVIL